MTNGTTSCNELRFINELFKDELNYAQNGGYREYHLKGFADILDISELKLCSLWSRLENHGVGTIKKDSSGECWFIPSEAFEEFCYGMAMMAGNNPPHSFVKDMEVFVNRDFYCAMQTIKSIGIKGNVLAHDTNLHGVLKYEFVPADKTEKIMTVMAL